MKIITTQRKGRVVFSTVLLITLILTLIIGGAFILYYLKGGKTISTRDMAGAEKIMDLRFSSKERKLMLDHLRRNRDNFKELRKIPLPNHIPPAFLFSPMVPGMNFEKTQKQITFSLDENPQLPENFEELAFYPVTKLAPLIKSGKITSTLLTKLYLKRLKEYGSLLKCVVTLTEDLALDQARVADKEIAKGIYRGPLHGIPWGAKDLLSTKGIKTTWGATPYKDQLIEEDATVVKRLNEAGAVLVAKLSMGALAMGDIWFGGQTRNPWDLEQRSRGSSAGPGAATSAGLVGFSIGTETRGSIVAPSARCGVTGLRPTFGMISRHGVMALSWSMDKIGPICRSAEDCAIVFSALYGPDGKDLTVVNFPFNWEPHLELKNIRIGYLKKAFDKDYREATNDQRTLDMIRSLGIELIPFDLPDLPTDALSFILNVEAAAAFDELTRSNKDDLLVRQGKRGWPNNFRQARFIPAVEYIQANRLRTLLMYEMVEQFKTIDVYVTPSFDSRNLLITNLTGHPAVIVPNGFDKKGNPTSISFIGNLYEEAKTLRVAMAFQEVTDHHIKHPKMEK